MPKTLPSTESNNLNVFTSITYNDRYFVEIIEIKQRGKINKNMG
jgi:hypothetical protein